MSFEAALGIATFAPTIGSTVNVNAESGCFVEGAALLSDLDGNHLLVLDGHNDLRPRMGTLVR